MISLMALHGSLRDSPSNGSKQSFRSIPMCTNPLQPAMAGSASRWINSDFLRSRPNVHPKFLQSNIAAIGQLKSVLDFFVLFSKKGSHVVRGGDQIKTARGAGNSEKDLT
jgi:hypothetical protein